MDHQELLNNLLDENIGIIANHITAARLVGPPPVEGSGLMPAGAYDNQEALTFENSVVIAALKENLGAPAVLPNVKGDFKNTATVNNESDLLITNQPEPGTLT